MEENNGFEFIIKGDEVPPQSSKSEPTVENASQKKGSPVNVVAAPPIAMIKKKRGRPRKYAAHGSSLTLSPMPISASVPLAYEFPAWNTEKNTIEFGSSESLSFSSGGGFSAHVITVNPGEDIMMRILSFSRQGYRAICILAANGSISNVTLRQSNSSSGTLTYEGRFEILSLSGSFMAADNGDSKSTSGGMSVSLAGPDGRVMGGGLGGVLVAADPVQIVIGSFAPLRAQTFEKKSKYERTISFAAQN